jgi:hypothetical protein
MCRPGPRMDGTTRGARLATDVPSRSPSTQLQLQLNFHLRSATDFVAGTVAPAVHDQTVPGCDQRRGAGRTQSPPLPDTTRGRRKVRMIVGADARSGHRRSAYSA